MFIQFEIINIQNISENVTHLDSHLLRSVGMLVVVVRLGRIRYLHLQSMVVVVQIERVDCMQDWPNMVVVVQLVDALEHLVCMVVDAVDLLDTAMLIAYSKPFSIVRVYYVQAQPIQLVCDRDYCWPCSMQAHLVHIAVEYDDVVALADDDVVDEYFLSHVNRHRSLSAHDRSLVFSCYCHDVKPLTRQH